MMKLTFVEKNYIQWIVLTFNGILHYQLLHFPKINGNMAQERFLTCDYARKYRWGYTQMR